METITSATSLIQGTSPCMLGLWHGVCRYYISGQPVSFSLGEAIAAVGLIFAVYQLKKISWELRLEMRGWLGDLFGFLGFLGVISILASVFVANMPMGLIPEPFSLPLFYEVLGFIFFLLSPFFLFWIGYKRRNFFNVFNAKRFYDVIHHNIVRTEPERLEAVVDIILENLPRLVGTLSLYQKPKTWKEKITAQLRLAYDKILGIKRVNEKKDYASAVFNIILCEKRVADYIVAQRMDFVGRLFFCLKHNEYTIGFVQGGVGKIFQRLLQNENSILYNQLHDYDGLSYSANLFKFIFEDYELIKTHKPFHIGIQPHTAGIYGSLPVQVFLKAFESSLKSYLSVKRTCIDNYALIRAFDTLENYFEGLCLSLNSTLDFNEVRSDIQSISHFYGSTFPTLFQEARQKNLLYEFDSRMTRFDDPESLTEAYTRALYRFIRNISFFQPKKEQECSVSFYVERAWEAIEGNDFKDVRENLLKLVWEQITEANVSKGNFPPVLRTYLLILPWGDTNARTDWMGVDKKRMAGLLGTLKPSFLKKAKMVDRTTLMEDILLPKCIKFFKKENKIRYINQFNELIDIV